jgi:hypothetical protein
MSDSPARQKSETQTKLDELFAGRDEHLDTVLRSHLFIEQLLEAMLVPWFAQPKYLDEARLSFSQKLHLARGLNVRHPDEPIWRAIAALNVLRNDFAHRLTSTQREQKTRTFIEVTRSDYPDPEHVLDDERFSLLERFMLSISYLVGSLEQVVREYEARARVGDLAGKGVLHLQYGWKAPSESLP